MGWAVALVALAALLPWRPATAEASALVRDRERGLPGGPHTAPLQLQSAPRERLVEDRCDAYHGAEPAGAALPTRIRLTGRVVDEDGQAVPFARVRSVRTRWQLVADPSGVAGAFLPRRASREGDEVVADDRGVYTLTVAPWDADAPGRVRSYDAGREGELALPRDVPEEALEDLVLRPVEPSIDLRDDLPELRFRAVDGETGLALCSVWAKGKLCAGELVVGDVQCLVNRNGEGLLYELNGGHAPPGLRRDHAKIKWTAEGFDPNEEHVVEFVGRRRDELIEHRLTPLSRSMLVRGRVVRGVTPVVDAEVSAELVMAARADGTRHSSSVRSYSRGDGTFALRVDAYDAHAVRVMARTTAGDWALCERHVEPEGSPLTCVLALEPMVQVPVVLEGLQPDLEYEVGLVAHAAPGSAFASLDVARMPLDLDPNGNGATTLRLPASRRVGIQVLGRVEDGVADCLGRLEWDPSTGRTPLRFRLYEAFVVVSGRVEGVAAHELPELRVVASHLGRETPNSPSAYARIASDGTFSFTIRRGGWGIVTALALLRPRPGAEACDVLATHTLALSEPRKAVVLYAEGTR